MRLAWKTASVLLLAILASNAAADSEVASELERRGIERANQGDFLAALTFFRKALQEAPSTGLVCNMGNAYLGTGQWPAAHALLRRCLADTSPDDGAEYYASVSASFVTVEAQLANGAYGVVEVKLPVDATVHVASQPSDVVVETSGEIWLPVGDEELLATADGYESQTRRLSIRKGANPAIEFELQRTAGLDRENSLSPTNSQSSAAGVVSSERTTASVPSASVPSASVPSASVQTSSTSRPRMLGAMGGAAVGVGALVLGGYFSFEAKSKRDEQRSMQLPPGEQYDALASEGKRLQTLGTGFLLGGAAASALAAYLYWTADDEPRSSSLEVSSNSLSVHSAWAF